MSLRKSPTLTPALLASNRRNARKSTGPRTARGKAWSRLNRLRSGARSPEYKSFLNALCYAPPGLVEEAARAFLSSQPVVHPLYMRMAEMVVQAESGKYKERPRISLPPKPSGSSLPFEPGISLKTMAREIAALDEAENLLKINVLP